MRITGAVSPLARAAFVRARQSVSETGAPPASATSFVFWIVAPSASGSVNGTPSSIISVPPRSIPIITSTVSSSDG